MNEKLMTALQAELAMLNENYALEIRSAVRLLEDSKDRSASSHLGHNLGNRATELSVLAGKIDTVKRFIAHLETLAKEAK